MLAITHLPFVLRTTESAEQKIHIMLTKLLTIFVKGLTTNIVAYPIFRKVIVAQTDWLSVKKVLMFKRLF